MLQACALFHTQKPPNESVTRPPVFYPITRFTHGELPFFALLTPLGQAGRLNAGLAATVIVLPALKTLYPLLDLFNYIANRKEIAFSYISASAFSGFVSK